MLICEEPMTRPNEARRTTVLLLEDEALIAMDLDQWLTEVGFEVVGPFRRNRDAFAALDCGTVDFAVLDYVLADENSGEVAERLTRLGVPYLFLTGARDVLLGRTPHNAPILEKPISRPLMMQALARISPLPPDCNSAA
jgi:DNA-binding response OmpR family regulator